ncbi:signal recognition particle subunit SRP72 [Rhipicephalus sanguineus]|uniref:signal recognition particle subunit SRP72 n=1 Tax=Rhipicephalus sanguineus TaxID=34632 RepID=UPI0018957298|nr:signal recognition particle subunit SRP72 [Rhipicephalus sanguineus]
MAQTNTSAALSGFYLELRRYGKSGEYDRALKVCDKILHEFPTEEKALQCKVVCLIQLGNFKDAIDVINKNSKHIGDMAFEKAYCLYRLNDTKEAWKLLSSITTQSFRVKELKAQVLYRLENYQECFDVYKDLIKNSEDEYEEERQTNLAAVIASLTMQTEQEVKGAPSLGESSYELCYNKACTLLGLAKYADALQKLVQAEELCKKSLEDDDLPEDEIEEELAIVRTQLGYAKQRLGHPDQAMKLYNLTLKQRPSDNAIIAVAANNIVTINKDQNMFDSKKKIKMAVAEGLDSKLTSQQRRAIALNHCLLLYHTGQLDQCVKAIATLEKNFTNAADEAVLLRAATMHCKDKQLDKAVRLLKEYAEHHPSRSLSISLTLAQLLLSQGHLSDCCDILKSLGATSYKLGIISALVTVYKNLEDKEATAAVFADAISWYKKNKPRSAELNLLTRESAKFYLANGQVQEAASVLEELRKVEPQDPKVLAQLISAYSVFDPKKAKMVSADLPPAEEITRQVDVDALETMSWTMGARYVKKVVKSEASPVTRGEDIVKKKKKKKKGKLPKNYDPNVDPDPERWLPRRERSTFKKRKDRRGASSAIGKGTQGAVGSTSEADMAQRTTPLPSPAAPAAQSSPGAQQPSQQGPRQQRPLPAQKKKKKKGGRW